jgi:hypothetical protein
MAFSAVKVRARFDKELPTNNDNELALRALFDLQVFIWWVGVLIRAVVS